MQGDTGEGRAQSPECFTQVVVWRALTAGNGVLWIATQGADTLNPVPLGPLSLHYTLIFFWAVGGQLFSTLSLHMWTGLRSALPAWRTAAQSLPLFHSQDNKGNGHQVPPCRSPDSVIDRFRTHFFTQTTLLSSCEVVSFDIIKSK